MTRNALLKMLEPDALLSDGQIAARLGVEAADVAELRARLEAEGRIVGYQAILNDDKEGVCAHRGALHAGARRRLQPAGQADCAVRLGSQLLPDIRRVRPPDPGGGEDADGGGAL